MGQALENLAANDQAPDCRRVAKRSRVMLTATIETAASKIPVIVKDISCTGAQLQSKIAPNVGSYVTFERGDISVVAKVVRSESGKVALQFRERIDERALLISIGKGGPAR